MNSLRNRFPYRSPSRTASRTAEARPNFLRASLSSLGFASSDNLTNVKTRTPREVIRMMAAYLGFIVTVVTVLAFYYGWILVDERVVTSDFSESNVIAPISDWHRSIQEIRGEEVINHRYDSLAISILVKGDSVESEDHSAVSTFLRQINHLQVATDTKANTFVGGVHKTYVEFENKSTMMPRLERYIDGFVSMLAFSPLQDWFIQVDDDSYLFLENIFVYLRDYNPLKSSVFIHNFDILRKDATHFPILGSDTGHFPVSIISRKALEILTSSDYLACIHRKQYLHSEETALVRCLEELDVIIVQEPILHATEPNSDFNWPMDSCTRPLSISQLSDDQIAYLYRSRAVTGSADGKNYKWDEIVTYSEVFHHTFDNSKQSIGVDRHSAAKSHTSEAISGKDCQTSCQKDSNCLSWTYDNPKCYTSESIGISVPRSGVVSGVINYRYVCLAGSSRF